MASSTISKGFGVDRLRRLDRSRLPLESDFIRSFANDAFPESPRARVSSLGDCGGNASRESEAGVPLADVKSAGSSAMWFGAPTAGPDPATFPLSPDRASKGGQ